MDESLERFLGEVRERLLDLPAPERERRYDAICRELERGIASELGRGHSEENAVAFAVAQVDLASYTAPLPPPRTLRQRVDALPPVAVAALYCAVAHTILSTVFAALFASVASVVIPHGTFFSVASAGLCLAPSLVAAVVGVVVLLVRGGGRPAVRRLMAPDTLTGAGVRWIALSQGLSTALWLVLLFLLRSMISPDFLTADGPPSSIVLMLVLLGLALATAAPFAAGWLVGHRTGTRQAFEGVRIAAFTGFLLTIADQFAGTFRGDSGSEFWASVLLLLVVGAGSAIYASLGIIGAYLGSFAPAPRK